LRREARVSLERLRRVRSCTFALLLAIPLAAAPNEPLIVLSQTEIRFDPQPQGVASTPQTVAVSNTGNAGLTIDTISITGEQSQQFAETHNCPIAPAALPPGGVCQIQVLFQPQIVGDLAAALTISDDASGSPQSVKLYGRAGAPVPQVALSPTNLVFGSRRVGGASTLQVIVLKNTGSATLHIDSAIRIDGASGSEFHLRTVHQPCPEATGELAPNATCSIGVLFSPVSVGTKNAQVVIDDDAAGSPHTVALSGSGG
jgi:hypothetical protein